MKGRSDLGEFTKLKNGRVKIRLGLGRDMHGEYHYFKKTIVGTVAQARELAREAKRRFQSGLAPTLEQETFGSFWEEFLRAKKAEDLRRNTITNYQAWARAYLLPALGNQLMCAITAREIQLLYDRLLETHEASTVRRAHGLLKQVIDLALVRNRLERNPLAGVKAPVDRASGTPERLRAKALSLEQIEAFLSAAADTVWRTHFDFLLNTGCRVGEMLGLCWNDVDLERGHVSIKRTLSWESSAVWYVNPPKTRLSARVIILDPATLAQLQAHRRFQLECRLKAGREWQSCKDERGNALDFVFTHSNGTPLNDGLIRYWCVEIAKAARIPHHVTTHDLRHTFATRALAGGGSLASVSGTLGHSGFGITGKYVHPDGEMSREATTAFANLFKGAKKA